MADVTITAANVAKGSGATTVRGTAGATITAGQAVSRDSTGKFVLADSDSATAAVRDGDGIALNGASDGQPLEVLTAGAITIGGTLTAGLSYWLSDTPGGICPYADLTTGDYAILLGVATSASVLQVALLNSAVAL